MNLEVALVPVSDVDRADVDAARKELIGRGIAVSEVFHWAGGPS